MSPFKKSMYCSVGYVGIITVAQGDTREWIFPEEGKLSEQGSPVH